MYQSQMTNSLIFQATHMTSRRYCYFAQNAYLYKQMYTADLKSLWFRSWITKTVIWSSPCKLSKYQTCSVFKWSKLLRKDEDLEGFEHQKSVSCIQIFLQPLGKLDCIGTKSVQNIISIWRAKIIWQPWNQSLIWQSLFEIAFRKAWYSLITLS